MLRKQFRVWDKIKEKMLYQGFIMRNGNPWEASYYNSKQPEYAWCNAEPLEEPTLEQREAINKIMGDETASYSLIDWSNFYSSSAYIEMQATGMHDRDGKLIWEMDLLKHEESGIVSTVEWYYCNFIWNGGQLTDFRDFDRYGEFLSERVYEGDHFGLESKHLIKIGNIFEDGLKYGYDWRDFYVVDEKMKETFGKRNG